MQHYNSIKYNYSIINTYIKLITNNLIIKDEVYCPPINLIVNVTLRLNSA
ncbi:MAG: hypothetical protein ACI8WT_003303 [Clostridium sp.]|jgi:hypothetical protein